MSPLTALHNPLDAILVPQGAEYQAVRRALPLEAPELIPLAIGPQHAAQRVASLRLRRWRRVLVTGVCGSLEPGYGVGTVAVCNRLVDTTGAELNCDPLLTSELLTAIPMAVSVKGLTSHRGLWLGRDKQVAWQRYGAQVVDLESYPLLAALSKAGMAVSVLRVVSDDCTHDLPNLDGAIASDGRLRPWPLAASLLSQPLAGYRLVRGSWQALRVLRQTLSGLMRC